MKTPIKVWPFILGAVSVLGSAGVAWSADKPDAHAIAIGRLVAEQNCSICHAIGRTGESPNPASPPFRTLSNKYPLDSLEEALAEGISVGHAEMPKFEFDPNQVAALIAYLKSIQPAGGGK